MKDIFFQYHSREAIKAHLLAYKDEDILLKAKILYDSIEKDYYDTKKNNELWNFLNDRILNNSEPLSTAFIAGARSILMSYIEKSKEYDKFRENIDASIREYLIASELHYFFRSAWIFPVGFRVSYMSNDFCGILTDKGIIDDIIDRYDDSFLEQERVFDTNVEYLSESYVEKLKNMFVNIIPITIEDKVFINAISNKNIRISVRVSW
jgi:hypothetical protein